MEQERLTPRQWALKRFLEREFVPNYYLTIEYVCENCRYPDGSLCYQLNHNPYNHDKCVNLSADVRTINWSVNEGYKIIVKDSKGSIKLCESESEFESWRQKELKPLEKKWKYLNTIRWKAERDGIVPLINLNDRVIDYNEEKPTPIEVYAKNY